MPPSNTSLLWTIGHSTRSIEEFISLLQTHGIQFVADVRTVPYSRRNPQFNTGELSQHLGRVGLNYQSMKILGGHRKPRPNSTNLGWRNASFRGYADYMESSPFWQGLETLMHQAATSPTAIMCAEAVPWRCHRSLIADAMVSRGWTVRHILAKHQVNSHELSSFARVENGKLHYPHETKLSDTPRLFY